MSTRPRYSLNPTSGVLKPRQLMHLLRRCLFGVSFAELKEFEGLTADECLKILLHPARYVNMLPQEDPDVEDPLVAHGEDWTNAPYENEIIDKRRRVYLKSWWVGRLLSRNLSVTEKMTLFWHNHLATAIDSVADARFSYRYAELLRKNALGNIRQLVRQVTTNHAMLVYLNGTSNIKDAPNENFSRELLELFTVGKGNTHTYTEDDVKAAARVLTGWKTNADNIEVNFVPGLHDTKPKQFSSFFNNRVIEGREGADGATETDELIEMIFSKKETAAFICRNLYRWFVSSHITADTEAYIITPLAETLMANNYNVVPVLRRLLASEHFFDEAFYGSIVKSPVDFFVGVSRQVNLKFPEKPAEHHLCWIHYNYYLGGLSQFIGDPPSVAGWPAYSQAPKFHQWWINSYTLGFRKKIIESLASAEGMSCNGPVVKFDFINFLNSFDSAGRVDDLINSTTSFLLAVTPPTEIISELTTTLNGGNNPTGWKEIWESYKEKPGSKSLQIAVEDRLRSYFLKIFNLPEFQVT